MTDEEIARLREDARNDQTKLGDDVVRLCDALTAARRERDEAEQRGRAAERADVVAWLQPRDDEEREAGAAILLRLIDCIERGDHVGAAGKGEP